MKKLNLAESMIGLSMAGGLLFETEKFIEVLPFVLAGDFDEKLYNGLHLSLARDEEFRSDNARVLLALENLKKHIRSFVQKIFELAAEEDRRDSRNEQLKRIEDLRQSLRESNRPHEMGTVAEIAQRYGISKSEVRRRKAEGTLHELQKS